MNEHRKTAHVSFAAARGMGPPTDGNLAVPVFSSGSLEVELYSLQDVDTQQPHSRDEIYIVARGDGVFFDGEAWQRVSSGSFVFVPAGQEHRFEDFSDDFAVWVIFYGPEGGESG